jgi:hypothetical protein
VRKTTRDAGGTGVAMSLIVAGKDDGEVAEREG